MQRIKAVVLAFMLGALIVSARADDQYPDNMGPPLMIQHDYAGRVIYPCQPALTEINGVVYGCTECPRRDGNVFNTCKD